VIAAIRQPSEVVGINPTILRWAREWRGRTVEDAAGKVKKSPSDILDWEAGRSTPTFAQARALAQFYERSFLEFFLDEPPQLAPLELVPDFRLHRGQSNPADDRELQLIQAWAQTTRLDALDLCAQLGVEVPEIPHTLRFNTNSDVESAALEVRDSLDFTIQDQLALTKADARTLPNILRERFEDFGVLTLRRPDLKKFWARGICIAQNPLPVIVVQNESATAQAFTLAHELGHILLGESGIIGERKPVGQPIERWCDRFAAAFLMPIEVVSALVGQRPPKPSATFSDETLERVADILRVSPHAMLVRLVHLGYVEDKFYWNVKKPQFDTFEADTPRFGRSKYYGARYRAQMGDFYTSLVLEAWATGRLSNHNAAEYMGIKRIDHLDAIRREFVSQ
jgi:Zn-dependent peptidase ImmA (M78 family)/transcriptional regulator with XRE-family HTH domain